MKCVVAMCTPIPGISPYRLSEANGRFQPLRKADDSVDRLRYEVAYRFGVQVTELRGRERFKSAAAARHVFWWVARRAWKFSFPELGRMLRATPSDPPRDHTTVMAAIKKIDGEVQKLSRVGTIALEVLDQLETETANGATTGPTSSSGSNEEIFQP